MATIKLRLGVNPVSFIGTTELLFSSLAWINTTNIAFIYAVSPNGSGHSSFRPGLPSSVSSFKPVTDGTIAGYNIVTKVALTIDAAPFMLSVPPDTYTIRVPAGGTLVTETALSAVLSTRAKTLTETKPANVSLVEYRHNQGNYGSLAAVLDAIKTQPNSDFDALGTGTKIQVRITRTDLLQAITSFTAIY